MKTKTVTGHRVRALWPVQDRDRTLLYRRLAKPTQAGVIATLVGYRRGGQTFFYSALLLAGLLFLSGCATPNGTDAPTAARITPAVKLAAYVGTAEYLRAHPESRDQFATAATELTTLTDADQVDLATLLAIAHRLPVKELKSDRAAIYVTAATILLTDYGATIPADQLNQLQPIARAMRDGIELALPAGN